MPREILCLNGERFRELVDATIREALEEEAVRKSEIRLRSVETEADLKLKAFALKQATVSPATLAERLGIGESTLRQRYECDETGTIGRAITIARLARAARLLVNRRATTLIRDIALESGWSDPRAFAKCFRELFGCDPSHYQARCEARERRGAERKGDGQLPTAAAAGAERSVGGADD